MDIKSILPLRLEAVQNAEYFRLNSVVLDSVNDSIASKYNLGPFIVPLKDAHGKYFKLYLANKRSMIVPEAKGRDKGRDNQFIAFKNQVSFFKRVGLPAEKEAAQKLDFLISTYKSANNEDYLTNTSMLVAFIRDARDEKFAPHIETLGLTELVNQIEITNNEFDALYSQRNEEKLTKDQDGNITQLRRTTLEPAYRKLVTVINAFYTTAAVTENSSQLTELGLLIDQLNAEVRDLTRKISARGGKVSSNQNFGNKTEAESDNNDSSSSSSSEGISL